MTLAFWFWLFYVLSLLYGFWVDRVGPDPYPRFGRHVMFYVLVGLLGWKAFGGPVN